MYQCNAMCTLCALGMCTQTGHLHIPSSCVHLVINPYPLRISAVVGHKYAFVVLRVTSRFILCLPRTFVFTSAHVKKRLGSAHKILSAMPSAPTRHMSTSTRMADFSRVVLRSIETENQTPTKLTPTPPEGLCDFVSSLHLQCFRVWKLSIV